MEVEGGGGVGGIGGKKRRGAIGGREVGGKRREERVAISGKGEMRKGDKPWKEPW